MIRPPFSLKGLREHANRVWGARQGWKKRRHTSEQRFPFRLLRVLDAPKERDLSWLVLAAVIVIVLLIVAGLCYSL